MRRLIIKPFDWKCSLDECAPGFFVYNDQLCFKTEYGANEVYCSSGEHLALKNIEVQPAEAVWEEV